MSQKRKIGGERVTINKRQRLSRDGDHNSSGYGLRAVLPSADDIEDDYSGGVISEEALAYLRAVKIEANTVPRVLVALGENRNVATKTEEENGYYEDGAYIAAPEVKEEADDDDDWEDYDEECGGHHSETGDSFPPLLLTVNPSDAYHERICAFFIRLCVDLDEKSPLQGGRTVPQNYVEKDPKLPKTIKDSMLYRVMASMRPTKAYVADLSKSETMQSIAMLSDGVFREHTLLKSVDDSNRLNSWAVYLMAHWYTITIGGSADVWVVRQLGRRAWDIAVTLKDDMETEADRASLELKRDASIDDAPASLPSLHRRNTSSSEGSGEDEQDQISAFMAMRAAVDIVLTIVGEVFGQRDLLVARDAMWIMM